MTSDELKMELERRLVAHRLNPSEGFTWNEVKAGLQDLI